MNNREKILNVAIKLIAERGYDAVSIRQITREVGIKESSFYNHFASKQGLLKEIFTLLQEDLDQNRISPEEIKELAEKVTLREFLEYRMNKFLDGWRNETARRLWYVISQQQYKNKQAAELIVDETEKSIKMYEIAFGIFMAEGKMKQEDPHFLAMLFGFSFRALHLHYTYRHFVEIINDSDFNEMRFLLENFSNKYSI